MTPERKRDLLIALCDAQRDQLGILTARLEAPLRIADRGVAVCRFLRDRPLIVGAIAAVLAARRGRGIFKWAQRGLVVWRAYRSVVR